MKDYSVILVDIDPHHSYQPALEKALSFEYQRDVTIVLYVGVFHPAIEASHLLDDDALSQAKGHIIDRHNLQLANLVQSHPHDKVKYQTQVSWHAPLYDGIIRAAKQHDAQLIIKSSAPHPLSHQIFFTPSDWQLMKASPVPVLLTKGNQLASDAPIVCAVDPMHKLSQNTGLDDEIIEQANNMAKLTHSPVHTCHSFDPSYWQLLVTYFDVSGVWSDLYPDQHDADPKTMLDRLKNQHKQGLNKLSTEHGIPGSAQHFIDGSLNESLPMLIQQLAAGTIVVGTSYRTGLLGSTAQWLLETCSCDVLAVKAKNFESPVN